jgi:hypothetical protein
MAQLLKTKLNLNCIEDFIASRPAETRASVIKSNKLMLFMEITVVCSKNHKKKHINELCGQNVKFLSFGVVLQKATTAL